ncbi:MAG: 23S rRNA (guanosine(2251)-2'-O)-methyltransferase RlmB [Streptococcaceae bacterium]|jgi:23S rRNA (guanosine2251-2'-O)-methyltransferase|nr:23S rRNA (guanosine(2251)-2'-O)-methyltransferase RlmB [Streptococcaceae bacterium]
MLKNGDRSKSKEKILEDFIFGYHASLAALKSGRVNKIFLQENIKSKRIDELKSLAKSHVVPVKVVPKTMLDRLTQKAVHQGVVVTTSPYAYLELEELLQQTKNPEPFYLVLDSLEDPHNLGSILRTADAVGVDGVLLPKHRSVGVTSTVVKTSTGAVEHLPIARVTNLMQAVAKLKQEGFWIFGTDMNGTDYRKWQVQGKIALIIGNESRGMSQLLRKEVDEVLTIPMVDHVQSLNASVAAGLLMYEVFRGRTIAK